MFHSYLLPLVALLALFLASCTHQSPDSLRQTAIELQCDRRHDEAARVYVQLLATVDDAQSGEDLLNLFEIINYFPEGMDASFLCPGQNVAPKNELPNQALTLEGGESYGGEVPEIIVEDITFGMLVRSWFPQHDKNIHFRTALAKWQYEHAGSTLIHKDAMIQFAGIPEPDSGWKKYYQLEALHRLHQLAILAFNGKMPPEEQFVVYKTLIDVLLDRINMDSGERLNRKFVKTPFDSAPDARELSRKSLESKDQDESEEVRTSPSMFSTPKTWTGARNDMERVAFLLQEAAKVPGKGNEIALFRARCLMKWYALPTNMPMETTKKLLPPTPSNIAATLFSPSGGVEKDDWRRISLPPECQYRPILLSLCEQKDSPLIAMEAISLLCADYISRLDFDSAVELARRGLIFSKEQRGKFKDNMEGDPAEMSAEYFRTICAELDMPYATFVTHDHSNGEVTLRVRNTEEVTLTVQPIDLKGLADITREDAVLKNLFYESWLPGIQRFLTREDNEKDKRFRQFIGKTILKQTIPVKLSREEQVCTIPLNIPDGTYIVTSSVPNGQQYLQFVNKGSLKLISRQRSGNKMIWFTVDEATGKPIPGVQLRGDLLYNVEDSSEKITLPFTAQTDDKGLWIQQLPTVTREGKKLELNKYFCLAELNGAIVPNRDYFSSFDFHNPNTPPRQQLVLLASQPIYKTGQRAQLIARPIRPSFINPSLTSGAGTSYLVTVRGPRNTLDGWNKKEVTTDATNAIELDIPLPDDADLGNYTVSLVPRNASSSGKGGVQKASKEITACFRVEEYKKPEFKVSIVPETPSLRLGKEVACIIRAEYYSGGPVSNAKVQLEIDITSGEKAPAERWVWDYLFQGNSRYWKDSRIGSIEKSITLDEKGEARVLLSAFKENKVAKYNKVNYDITAKVADASLREVQENRTLSASRSPFALSLVPSSQYIGKGEAVTIKLTAKQGDGKVAANVSGTCTVHPLKRNNEGKEDDEMLTISTKSPLLQSDITTDDEGKATIVFPADALDTRGILRFTVTLTSPDGETSEAHLDLPSRNGRKGSHPAPDQLNLLAHDKQSATGTKARFLIETPAPTGYVWLFPHAGWTKESYSMVTTRGHVGESSINLRPEDMPNTADEAFTVYQGKLQQTKVHILVPPDDKRLQAEASADKQTLKPGEETGIKIAVRDAAGNPPPAGTLVTLAVYDQALEYFSGPPEVLERMLWSRSNTTQTPGFNASENPPSSLVYHWKSRKSRAHSDLSDFVKSSLDVVLESSLMERSCRFKAKSMESDISYAPCPVITGDSEEIVCYIPSDKNEPGNTNDIPIRSNFTDNILWRGILPLASDGTVTIPVTMADNLTTWQVRAWIISPDLSFGEASATIISTKDILASLQMPRFLTAGDTATLSTIIRNRTDKAVQAHVTLKPSPSCPAPLEAEDNAIVEVPAQGSARVDWKVRATQAGTAQYTTEVRSGAGNDAMQMSLPVLPHGMHQTHVFSGALAAGSNEATVKLNVPEATRRDDARLTLTVSPSVILPAIDSLPYLQDFPHDCAEQTLNRFLGTLLVRHTLKELNIAIPDKSKEANCPLLFDKKKTNKFVKTHIDRLVAMQGYDGGWSWFGQADESDPVISAIVYRGLSIASSLMQNAVPERSLEKAAGFLGSIEDQRVARLSSSILPWKNNKSRGTINEEDILIRRALSTANTVHPGGISNDRMMKLIARDAQKTGQYSQIMAARLLLKENDKGSDEVKKLASALQKQVVTDAMLGTARLKNPGESSCWWFWHGNDTSIQAEYLQLLCELGSDTAAPIARGIVLKRQYASHWESTLSTANALEALCQYALTTKEGVDPMQVDVLSGDRVIGSITLTRDNLLTAPRSITLEGDAIFPSDAASQQSPLSWTIRRKDGKGRLYINGLFNAYTTQDPLPAAGLNLTVKRNCYRVVPASQITADTPLQGKRITKGGRDELLVPLADGDTVDSGTEIEVELVFTARHDCEYICTTDPRPAGCESTLPLSGYGFGDHVSYYQEPREEESRFYFNWIPKGEHTITYRLRAERPGFFRNMPTVVEAMYAPELRGNARESSLKIDESSHE